MGGVKGDEDVYGSEPNEKTSPETRMGTRSPYLSVRSSRASRLMGVLEGVLRVRGWMVRKSICRPWGHGPRTVSIKSIVFLVCVKIPSQIKMGFRLLVHAYLPLPWRITMGRKKGEQTSSPCAPGS